MSRTERVESLVATARAAGSPVAVLGDGPDADALRIEFPASADPPTTVVETSGTVEGIREAMASVADLGTVVLAGPPIDPDPTLDLYGDLHVRGLTIIGAEAPFS